MGSKQSNKIPTTEDLKCILRQNWVPPINPFDEVYKGIYIGDAATALSLSILRYEGINHILNGALACPSCLRKEICGGCVLTREAFYKSDGIAFKGIQANDERRFPLYLYFEDAAGFIDEALNNGGKVLVHCREGVSRSATLVIAFLMMKRNMSAHEAVQLVRSKREIFPNDGFLQQICDLDIRLKHK